jgi:hypothetical protein
MKKYLYILIGFSLAFGLTVSAAPTLRYDRTILPETDSLYSLGSAVKAWLKIYADEICLAGDCQTSWPAGGGGDFATTTANYWLSTKDTDDLAEGSTNLYYTLARWATALAGTTTDALPEGLTNKYDQIVTLTEGDNITISGTYPDFTIAATAGSGSGTIGTSSDPVIGELAQWTGADTLASVATSTLNISTSDLIEGSKLFYTQARVWDDIFASSTLATILNNSVTAYLWGDHSLVGYLTKAAADLLYQPIGNYLNKDTDTYVVTETDPVWESEKSSYLTSITNLFDQWLDSTSTPIFAGLRLTGLADPAGSFLAVDPEGDLIATTTPSGSGGGTWGTITGTLSDQTDLQNALDDKAGLDTDNTFSLHNIFSSLFATNASTTNATTSSLAVTGSATSTFANGINLTDGCFAVSGTCLTTGGGGASALNDLSDVSLSGVAAGNILLYSGASWINSATNLLNVNFNALGVNKNVDTATAALDVLSETAGPSTGIRVENDNSGNTAFGSWITGSAGYLLAIKANGALEWSDGTAAADTNLYRSAANVLKTDDSLYIAGTASTSALIVSGSATSTFANGIDITDGCFAINGTCLTAGEGGGTSLWSTHANGIYYNSGKVGIGTTPDSSTGLTVHGGISSPMGDDLYNEAFGKNAYIDDTAFNNTTVIGYGASARSGYAKGGNTVIGAWATSTHAANTIIGSNSRSSAGYSVVIGADLSANSANSVLIGSNASIGNGATAAIGYSAVADENHSVAIGQGVNTDKQNQFMFGTRMKANAAPAFTLQGAVKAYTPRNIFEIITEWIDLTDETRQARVKFLTGDYTGALEFMRAETKGGKVDVSFPGDSLSIGDGTSQAGCLKIRDSDNDGWTYCSTLNGTLSCGTTACSGATLTIGGE